MKKLKGWEKVSLVWSEGNAEYISHSIAASNKHVNLHSVSRAK